MGAEGTVDLELAVALARGLAGVADPDARVDRIEEIVNLAGLVRRADGASLHDLVPLARFSGPQQEVLRAIALHHGSLGTVRVVGVPIFRFDVRPWAGVAPPRTIDTEAPGAGAPRWLVLQEQGLARVGWERAREPALDGLDAVERLDVVVSIAAGAYGTHRLFPTAGRPEAIAAALDEAGAPGVAWARALIDRLAATGQIMSDFGWIRSEHLGPLLRAAHGSGHPIPRALWPLIGWEPANRPLLEALPADERDRMALEKAARWGPPNLALELPRIEALADLLASPALVDQLRRIAVEAGELDGYAARLHALSGGGRA